MSAYSDNQEIEDLIVDVSISVEEADKAMATLTACKQAMNKSLSKLQIQILKLGSDDRELAAKYAKQVSDISFASLLNQKKLELSEMIARAEDDSL